MEKLTIIDGNSILFRAYYGVSGGLTRSDGVPTGAVYGFCNMLLPILAKSDLHEEVICVFDASKKNWRNDIYPEYKANRGDTPEDLLKQMEITRDAVRAMGIPVLAVHDVEADDVIATLVTKQCNIGMTRIITSDKDLMQLVSECCVLVDGMKNVEIGVPGVLEKFGVRPDQVVDVQSLMGDSTDNVPGVRGIGPKTAGELINEFGTLDNLYKNIDSVKKERIKNLLTEYKEMAYMSRKLVALKNDVEMPHFARKNLDFDKTGFINFALTQIESPALVAKINKLFANKTEKQTNSLFNQHLPEIKHTVKKTNKSYQLITSESELDEFLANIGDVLAIDTETTSLDQMSAKLVGISMATSNDFGIYIPLRHIQKTTGELFSGEIKSETYNNFDVEIIRKKLWPILTDNKILKIGHNLKYDFHVFENEGWNTDKISPINDTLLMSYVLDGTLHEHNLDELARLHLDHENIKFSSLFPQKTKSSDMNFANVEPMAAAEYSAEDSYICFGLYEIFEQRLEKSGFKKLYENCDLPLLRILMKMERAGVLINQSKLNDLSDIFHKKLRELESDVYKNIGHEFNIGSPKQLAEILFDELKLPSKKSRTTDADTLTELAEENPIVAKILEWRSISKLAGTYTDALPRQIGTDGRIHTTYLQTSTNTARLSSRDPNLQNIPIKTELGAEIRKCFVAPDGKVLISADYSQIQLRLLAHLADVQALKAAFAAGADIHEATARKIFRIPEYEPVPKDKRRAAKTINFSIIYGISPFGLAAQLETTPAEARKIIDSYLSELPEIHKYIEDTKSFVIEHGFVTTPWGRRIHIPAVNSASTRAYALRAAINAPIQGFEADLMRLAMVKLDEHLPKNCKMIMQVHDEIVFECDNESSAEAAKTIKEIMESIIKLSVPIAADTNIGTDWEK